MDSSHDKQLNETQVEIASQTELENDDDEALAHEYEDRPDLSVNIETSNELDPTPDSNDAKESRLSEIHDELSYDANNLPIPQSENGSSEDISLENIPYPDSKTSKSSVFGALNLSREDFSEEDPSQPPGKLEESDIDMDDEFAFLHDELEQYKLTVKF